MDISPENGWMLSLVFLSISYLPALLGGPGPKRLFDFSWISSTGKLLSMCIMILFLMITALPCFYDKGAMLKSARRRVIGYLNYHTITDNSKKCTVYSTIKFYPTGKP